MILTLVLVLIASVVTFIGALVDDFATFAKHGPDSEVLLRVRRERIYPTLLLAGLAVIISTVWLLVLFIVWALGVR